MTPTQASDKLLAAMGMDTLEGEERQTALEDVLYILNMRVAKRVSREFSEAQLDQFNELTANEEVSEDELSKWLAENVPNYLELINEEAHKMTDVDATLKEELEEDSIIEEESAN